MKCKQTKSPAQLNFQNLMHSHFDRQNTTDVSPFLYLFNKQKRLDCLLSYKKWRHLYKKIIWYKLSYSTFIKKIRTNIWEVPQQFVRMMADREKYLHNYVVFMQMNMDINKINDPSEIYFLQHLSPGFFSKPSYLYNLKSRTKFSIRCNINI